ncbi:MAG: ATP-binding protein [Desulfobulbaceae bacterium]|nr:ATP-binding protein [Desulfobulbaceae bacterium]
MRQIPEEQVVKRLQTENVWWATPNKIPLSYRNWSPREYFKLFFPLVKKRSVQRAVVLMGPRRVGKTVLIHHTIQELIKHGVPPKNICFFSVDHPIYNGLFLDQLLDIYQQATGINYQEEDCYIFFDEIQYLKNWETHLKAIVDRLTNIKCTVSGSAAAALRLKSAESGAGRFTDFLLPPLTFHEYLTLLGKNDLVSVSEDERSYFEATDIEELNKSFLHYLNFGGYPEVIFSEEIQQDPGRFIKGDIIDKVLLRDLPSLYGVQDVQELNYLFTTLAYNTANEVSLDELSKGAGVAKNTIKKYIEYLEAAFLIKTVHRVDRNAKRFKRANFFKVYLTNPSIRSALFSPVNDQDDAIGSLAETAVFSQWLHSEGPLHYARWKEGEIDIVNIDSEQNANWMVEVKWSDRFYSRPKDLKNVIQL